MTDLNSYIVSLISLCILCVLFFWLYKDYRVDRFRQKMFKLRDSLFDDANSGKISFKNETYQILRSTMNGSIRFGHRLNILQMIILMFITNKSEKSRIPYSTRLDESLASLNEDQKLLVEKYRQQMSFIIIEHMVFSSPMLIISIFIPVAFLLEAKKHISVVITPFKKPLDKFEDAALLLGK